VDWKKSDSVGKASEWGMNLEEGNAQREDSITEGGTVDSAADLLSLVGASISGRVGVLRGGWEAR
jgi:hypothetical protein